ncbi:MAG: sulfatase-like hydrolase/transferase [Candidatus Aquicultorales bacterium]
MNTSPDIYYIILDGYANSGTLQEFYDYDNKRFEESLRARGFYVADRSNSNYPITALSLPSSLNMRHLTELSGTISFKSLIRMAKNNEVMRYLKSKGYKYVHFSSGSELTNNNESADVLIESNGLDDFSLLLLNTTMLRPVIKRFIADDLANNVLDAFRSLEEAPSIKGPKFVFAHLLTPHPPYVFNRNGDRPSDPELGSNVFGDTSWLPRDAYLDQLIYINSKVLPMVDAIIAKSAVKPIIVIQSDHGPIIIGGMGDANKGPAPYLYDPAYIRGKTRIFNAYYLPRGGQTGLYDTITPVNSFRVIFNYYFSADFPLLEDKTYYSTYNDLTDFQEVDPEDVFNPR